MVGKAYIHLMAVAAAALSLLCSCSGQGSAMREEDEAPRSYVEGLNVTIATRAESGSDGQTATDKPYNIEELIPYELLFDESTILQVSQQAVNIPPFQTEDAVYDYEYISSYVAPENAWDDDECYNFTPYRNGEPLEWNKISDRGSYNGSFALYCMYFPLDNHIRSIINDAGAINYSVMEDQSTVDNLKRSDILGAYHSTPEIFSRIRFRLFHLMTYLRIRLYVPVYDDTKNTGYREDALRYATLDNVTPYFAIDWGINRSSDEQGPVVSPLSGDGRITMYQHPLPEGQTKREIEELRYADYLPKDYYDQGIEGDYDKVRAYDFSVIIPKQKGTVVDGKETNFPDTEFLNFYLRTNAGGTTRYYFTQSFMGSVNDSSSGASSGTLEIEQGVFQYLELYVPRVGNQVVFVGATVNPWNRMSTDMVLKEQQE